jgi:hypothetical protein
VGQTLAIRSHRLFCLPTLRQKKGARGTLATPVEVEIGGCAIPPLREKKAHG